MEKIQLTNKKEIEEEFSLKNYFVPLTTAKAVTWIVVIGLVVYANMLFNGFVWDDVGQVADSYSVRSLANIASFFFGGHDINGNLIKIHASFYRPLMETFFTLVYAAGGSNAFFFHFVSLLMQLSIAILVYFLFRRFFKQTLSFLFALVILVHPLNSEAVDYISAYNDLMYLLFGMISLILLQKKVLSLKRLLALSFFLFLSLLSKESGFLFIPIVLGYSLLFSKKNALKLIVVSLASTILYFLLRISLYVGIPEDQAFGFSPFLYMPLWLRLANIPSIFGYYLQHFFYPDHFSIAQQWSVQQITFSDFYLPLLVFLLFTSLNLYLLVNSFKKTNKEMFKNVLFFSLWFWVGIGLYFQLITLDMTVADRWFYFSMIGLLGLAGILFQKVIIKENYKILLLVAAVICLTLLSIRTMVRNTNWNSEKSLYLHDEAINQGSFDLENLVGMIYFENHNYSVAYAHFQRSIALYRCSEAVNNLGYLYQTFGKFAEAEKQYITAITCSHGYKDYGNLVLLLYREHRYNLAERYTKEGLQKFTTSAGLYFVLGLTQYQRGDKKDAMKNLAIGYQLSHDPQIAQAYQLIEQGKTVDLPLN